MFEKNEPLQGGRPIRGKSDDTSKVAGTFYCGKIPVNGIIELERELVGMRHGTASLVIHIRDGKLTRYTTGKERSFVGGDDDE
jgi:hypothetical protein